MPPSSSSCASSLAVLLRLDLGRGLTSRMDMEEMATGMVGAAALKGVVKLVAVAPNMKGLLRLSAVVVVLVAAGARDAVLAVMEQS